MKKHTYTQKQMKDADQEADDVYNNFKEVYRKAAQFMPPYSMTEFEGLMLPIVESVKRTNYLVKELMETLIRQQARTTVLEGLLADTQMVDEAFSRKLNLSKKFQNITIERV
jgi:hypothetical protein